jgi:hypothetical protein
VLQKRDAHIVGYYAPAADVRAREGLGHRDGAMRGMGYPCELRFNGVLRSSQAPLRGSGDVLPKQLLAPDADRGVAMDQFPFTVLPTEHAGITEGYLRAIG